MKEEGLQTLNRTPQPQPECWQIQSESVLVTLKHLEMWEEFSCLFHHGRLNVLHGLQDIRSYGVLGRNSPLT